jgi:hypothetical protein
LTEDACVPGWFQQCLGLPTINMPPLPSGLGRIALQIQ